MPDSSILHSVEEKKLALASIIREPLGELAEACGKVWPEGGKIDAILKAGINGVSNCKLIYAWNRDNCVVSAMINPQGVKLHPKLTHHLHPKLTHTYLFNILKTQIVRGLVAGQY